MDRITLKFTVNQTLRQSHILLKFKNKLKSGVINMRFSDNSLLHLNSECCVRRPSTGFDRLLRSFSLESWRWHETYFSWVDREALFANNTSGQNHKKRN